MLGFEFGNDKTSWADQVDKETTLPPKSISYDGEMKTTIEYHFDENGRRVKTIYCHKLIKRRIPNTVRMRRTLPKFCGMKGEDAEDLLSKTTYYGDEVKMQFIRNRAGEQLDLARSESNMGPTQPTVQFRVCRYCKSTDHWSTLCPYKELFDVDKTGEQTTTSANAAPETEAKIPNPSIYIPPSLRGIGGASKLPMDTMQRRDENTVRVTNLPEDISEDTLKDLFSAPGRVLRTFLAKDKATNRCKGYAFVSYATRENAQRAIDTLSGFRHDHLILKVEWARQSQ